MIINDPFRSKTAWLLRFSPVILAFSACIRLVILAYYGFLLATRRCHEVMPEYRHAHVDGPATPSATNRFFRL